MKAAFDGLGIIWGVGETDETSRSDAVDQIVELPRDQLREFIRTLVDGFEVRDISEALADKVIEEGGDVQMKEARVGGKMMLVTPEEAEASQ